MRPERMIAGRPTSEAPSSPVSWMAWKVPSGRRACWMPQNKGTAHCTPGTERTLCTSISLIGTTSLACSTLESATQIGTRMLRTVAVVHSSNPQNTDVC